MIAEQYREAITRLLAKLDDTRKLSNVYHLVLHLIS